MRLTILAVLKNLAESMKPTKAMTPTNNTTFPEKRRLSFEDSEKDRLDRELDSIQSPKDSLASADLSKLNPNLVAQLRALKAEVRS